MIDQRNDGRPYPHGRGGKVEMIPGEHDNTTLTHREPGAIGGQFAGADIPSSSESRLDEAERHDREIEGGGD